MFPIIGGTVIAILADMIITVFMKTKSGLEDGTKLTSKKILQWTVIPLGSGMNLNMMLETGGQSLPIVVYTIIASLMITFVLHELMHIPSNTSTLVGVGSSICDDSAIAATTPVINADDDEVAQVISVIFFSNVLVTILFPAFDKFLGFDTTSGNAFGVFTGAAVNGTSSVTAAAATWDSVWSLGAAALDKAATVKLTRTLAIIPITLCLALIRTRREEKADQASR